jgi:hypothetical protein
MIKMLLLTLVSISFLFSCKNTKIEKGKNKPATVKKEDKSNEKSNKSNIKNDKSKFAKLLKKMKDDMNFETKKFETPQVNGKILVDYLKKFKNQFYFLSESGKTAFKDSFKIDKNILTIKTEFYELNEKEKTLKTIFWEKFNIDINTKNIISVKTQNYKNGRTGNCKQKGKLFTCLRTDKKGKIIKNTIYDKAVKYGCFDCETYYFSKVKKGEYNCKTKCFNSLTCKLDNNYMVFKSSSNYRFVGQIQKSETGFYLFSIFESNKFKHFETFLIGRRSSKYKFITTEEIKKYTISKATGIIKFKVIKDK